MINYEDALSRFKDSIKDYKQRFLERSERKRNYIRYTYYDYKRLASARWSERVKPYISYAVFELAPYVAVYGLMINFPLKVLLGWPLSVETVASWGLVFYFVDQEFVSLFNELKPYIRVNAKVDN